MWSLEKIGMIGDSVLADQMRQHIVLSLCTTSPGLGSTSASENPQTATWPVMLSLLSGGRGVGAEGAGIIVELEDTRRQPCREFGIVGEGVLFRDIELAGGRRTRRHDCARAVFPFCHGQTR